jgi:ParB family chromosome partitioning protein
MNDIISMPAAPAVVRPAKRCREELEVEAQRLHAVYTRHGRGLLETGRDLGEILAELRGQFNANEWYAELDRLKIPHSTARRLIAKFKTPAREFNAHLSVTGQDLEENLAGHFAGESDGDDGLAHVGRATGNSEWYTPRPLVEAVRQVLGTIDMDPCSCAQAQEVVRATTFFSKSDDGLSKDWRGKLFMNPPYSHPLIDRFVEKLLQHYDRGDIPAAVALTNNGTETEVIGRLAAAASALCFPSPRVKFLNEKGEQGSPLQGQVLCFLGREPERFVRVFAEFGTCWRPAGGGGPGPAGGGK